MQNEPFSHHLATRASFGLPVSTLNRKRHYRRAPRMQRQRFGQTVILVCALVVIMLAILAIVCNG